MAHPSLTVLERHLLLYRRLWRASVFSFFISPVLFLLSVGFGVGAFVSEVQGVDYVLWIAPALLASTVFQIGVNESTYSIYTDFEWIGVFHVMRNTRVRIRDMLVGWFLYLLVVVEIAVVAFLAVITVFGVGSVPLLLAAPLVCALLALAVSAPTTAFSAKIRDDTHFQLLTQFGIVPLTLVSGVYFPVDRLPDVMLPLVYASPLWHGVELCRSAALGTDTAWPPLAHLGYLAVWVVAGYLLAHAAFRRRLAN